MAGLDRFVGYEKPQFIGRDAALRERDATPDKRLVTLEIASLDADAADDKIIEKLPMNYLYLGAIRRALPNASFLLLKRAALDGCFAMYRTLFGHAYPFSYDFEDLARYYAAYERLINHWIRVVGERLHVVVYEDLVREPTRVGRTLAAHCGIGWEDAATEIQNNQSVSLTASAAQVRRPIYASSSGRWRHYQKHLGGLIAALRRHGIPLPRDL